MGHISQNVTIMIRLSSAFASLLALARFSRGLAFIAVLTPRPIVPHGHVSVSTPLQLLSSRHPTSLAARSNSNSNPIKGTIARTTVLSLMQNSARWHLSRHSSRHSSRRLEASAGEGSGGEEVDSTSLSSASSDLVEGGADSSTSSTTASASLSDSVGNVVTPVVGAAGGSGVADLAKGIAFEAPKPKAGGVEGEGEEESKAKKVRTHVYFCRQPGVLRTAIKCFFCHCDSPVPPWCVFGVEDIKFKE